VVDRKRLLHLDLGDSDANLDLVVSEVAYLGVFNLMRSHPSQGNAATILRTLADIIESADRPTDFG